MHWILELLLTVFKLAVLLTITTFWVFLGGILVKNGFAPEDSEHSLA